MLYSFLEGAIIQAVPIAFAPVYICILEVKGFNLGENAGNVYYHGLGEVLLIEN